MCSCDFFLAQAGVFRVMFSRRWLLMGCSPQKKCWKSRRNHERCCLTLSWKRWKSWTAVWKARELLRAQKAGPRTPQKQAYLESLQNCCKIIHFCDRRRYSRDPRPMELERLPKSRPCEGSNINRSWPTEKVGKNQTPGINAISVDLTRNVVRKGSAH